MKNFNVLVTSASGKCDADYIFNGKYSETVQAPTTLKAVAQVVRQYNTWYAPKRFKAVAVIEVE